MCGIGSVRPDHYGRHLLAAHNTLYPPPAAFGRVRNQGEPLLTRAAAMTRAGRAVDIVERVFGFSVRVGAAVDRIRQHAVQHAEGWASPRGFAGDRSGGELQAVLKKPRER